MTKISDTEKNPLNLSRLSILLAIAGLSVICVLWIYAVFTIVHLRSQAWDSAEYRSENLLRSIERTIDRDVELYNLSLQAVVDRLRDPNLEGVSPEVRQMSLFDRSAQARGYGSIFVLDRNGDASIDSGSLIPRKLNGADRLYFTTHRNRPDAGLFIGRPWRTRVSGKDMIPLSRRLNDVDGAFAGVVVGAIELAYFDGIFKRLNTDPDFEIKLFFDDGNVTSGRDPDSGASDPIGPSNDDERGLVAGQSVRFVSADEQGRESRLHTHMQVARWPIRASVSLPIDTIRAAWRNKAALLILIVSVISVGIVALLVLLRRELARRIQAEQLWMTAKTELARLALVDGLTGLWNRRHFDRELKALEETKGRRAVSLLLIDADDFKLYNDLYGHPAGDHVLKMVGAAIEQEARKTNGVGFRIGGEEFAILVRDRDEAAAREVAEALRRTIERAAIPHAHRTEGVLTVSIGLVHSARFPRATASDWLSLADEALYRAKRDGRNRVALSGAAAPVGG